MFTRPIKDLSQKSLDTLDKEISANGTNGEPFSHNRQMMEIIKEMLHRGIRYIKINFYFYDERKDRYVDESFLIENDSDNHIRGTTGDINFFETGRSFSYNDSFGDKGCFVNVVKATYS